MKELLFIGILLGLFWFPFIGLEGTEQENLSLKRGGEEGTNSRMMVPGSTADKALVLATNTRPGDNPASGGTSGKIRLPPTIINIEDLSEMRLERDGNLRLLLPEIERARLRLDEPGRNPAFDHNGKKRKNTTSPGGDGDLDGSGRDGSGTRHVLSTFELTYGFYDTLEALVSTGLEARDMAWQVTYRRKRDEGFDKDGKRLANSLRGSDSLVFDFSWNRDAFDLSAGVVFSGGMLGLQGNTNFSQLRTIGLDARLQAGYIISTVTRMKLDFLLGHGTHVLDHPSARQEVENYSADAALEITMQWPRRLSLKTDIGLVLDESTDSGTGAHENSVTAFSGGSRFGFSIGPVSMTVGGRLLAGESAWFSPGLDANWRLSPEFAFFGDIGREVFFLRFRQSVLQEPFVSAVLPSLPVDRFRMAGGTRWQPSSSLSLVGTIVHASYSRYPGLVENADGLYEYSFSDPDVTTVSAEIRFTPGSWLDLKAGWQQRLTSEEVPWLPDWEITTSMDVLIPDSDTSLRAVLKIEGDRNLPGLGAYTLLDLRLQQAIGSTSSIIVDVRNLLGTKWRLRPLYWQPGLTLHAGFSARF
ncbi:MAG TPA: hypothetical protein PLD82_00660 [Spirochaetota bacterium]|mgnify:FL=1|nr:hypothetical protein [Spirochaetota bacterium]